MFTLSLLIAGVFADSSEKYFQASAQMMENSARGIVTGDHQKRAILAEARSEAKARSNQNKIVIEDDLITGAIGGVLKRMLEGDADTPTIFVLGMITFFYCCIIIRTCKKQKAVKTVCCLCCGLTSLFLLIHSMGTEIPFVSNQFIEISKYLGDKSELILLALVVVCCLCCGCAFGYSGGNVSGAAKKRGAGKISKGIGAVCCVIGMIGMLMGLIIVMNANIHVGEQTVQGLAVSTDQGEALLSNPFVMAIAIMALLTWMVNVGRWLRACSSGGAPSASLTQNVGLSTCGCMAAAICIFLIGQFRLIDPTITNGNGGSEDEDGPIPGSFMGLDPELVILIISVLLCIVLAAARHMKVWARTVAACFGCVFFIVVIIGAARRQGEVMEVPVVAWIASNVGVSLLGVILCCCFLTGFGVHKKGNKTLVGLKMRCNIFLCILVIMLIVFVFGGTSIPLIGPLIEQVPILEDVVGEGIVAFDSENMGVLTLLMCVICMCVCLACARGCRNKKLEASTQQEYCKSKTKPGMSSDSSASNSSCSNGSCDSKAKKEAAVLSGLLASEVAEAQATATDKEKAAIKSKIQAEIEPQIEAQMEKNGTAPAPTAEPSDDGAVTKTDVEATTPGTVVTTPFSAPAAPLPTMPMSTEKSVVVEEVPGKFEVKMRFT